MKFADAVAALDARTNYEASGRLVSPSLDRMRALSDLLAQPQQSYTSLHVTGTNGKTTVARIAGALLQKLGLAVGTYTSPHLHDLRERMTYDGRPISEEDFAETYTYLEPFLREVDAKGESLTWFETITALAQVWFAERAVDVAVVEVGMGGEWDATNLVDGRVAVVTEVALDHPELGATPEAVATEKSGIIKHGAVCVTAATDPAVLDVLRRRCGAVGAVLRRFGVDYEIDRRVVALGGQTLDVRVGEERYKELFLPLYGEALGTDAAIALAAVRGFIGDRSIDEDVVRDALAGVKDPGRVEVIGRHPLVVCDGAHNPAAAVALVDAMRASFRWERLVLVAGILSDKDLPGVLAPLVALADEVIATEPPSPRAAPAEDVAEQAALLGVHAEIRRDPAAALAAALARAAARDAVLVTGSLYTVAAVRSHLLQGVRGTQGASEASDSPRTEQETSK